MSWSIHTCSKSHSEQHSSPWREIPNMLGGIPHFCIPFTPSYVPGNLLLCVTTWRASRTVSPLMAVLILRHFYPLSFVWERTVAQVTNKKGKVRKSGRKQDRGKREPNLSLRSAERAGKREVSSQCVPHSCATADHAVTRLAGIHGIAAGGEHWQAWCALSPQSHVDTCYRISKEGEKQAKERRWAWIEVGDRRLKFGLWLVGVRRCSDKASAEREENPNPVRESGGVYLRSWEESEMKNYGRWDGAYLFTTLWKLQETCAS